LFSQAFCPHRQVAAEGFLFLLVRSISHGHTYLLVNNKSVIILPIRPKSAPGIAAWRVWFKGNEPKGIEKAFFLYASIMKYYYHATLKTLLRKQAEE